MVRKTVSEIPKACKENRKLIELDRIYNIDCMEGMKRIPCGSIDLIVTDPPYDIQKINSGGSVNNIK